MCQCKRADNSKWNNVAKKSSKQYKAKNNKILWQDFAIFNDYRFGVSVRFILCKNWLNVRTGVHEYNKLVILCISSQMTDFSANFVFGAIVLELVLCHMCSSYADIAFLCKRFKCVQSTYSCIIVAAPYTYIRRIIANRSLLLFLLYSLFP